MKRILLVEDNDANLLYLSTLLKAHGFEVESARHGAEALEKARQAPPELVISDLLMPVMDGYTLLRHWKSDARLSRVPFIVYTATYTDPEDEKLALNEGADAFIVKPTEPEPFLTRLLQVLDSAANGSLATPRQPADTEVALLKEYNQALVRKLEAKRVQLEDTNRALEREVLMRGELARTQTAILDTLAPGIALIDAQGIIFALNESWRRVAETEGPRLSEFGVGHNYLERCDQAHAHGSAEAGEIAAGIRRILNGEARTFVQEFPYNFPNQQQHWFRIVATPLSPTLPTGAVIMHVDITERKVAELKLEESQQQSLLLLNSTAEGIYGVDVNGVCTFCNREAARLLGYDDADQLIGQRVHDRHHHKYPDGQQYPISACKIYQSFKNGQGTHADDEVFIRADGTAFPVEYWSYPIRRESGVVGAVVTFLDITERRNLEARFLQAQKMEAVGQLAAGIAHDFNNVLTIIFGYCSLLLGKPEIAGATRQRLEEIRGAGERAAVLTQQLLVFSRKQVLHPQIVNLGTALEDVDRLFRRVLGENIEIVTVVEEHLAQVKFDPGQFQQVIMNLVVNARDAMPRGGKLTIELKNQEVGEVPGLDLHGVPPGRYVMLAVSDNGTGMEREVQERAFEPFFTTKEPGHGTGLGLATVYGIVRQSGGYIWLYSEPGVGTTFRIFLPRVDAPPDALPQARISAMLGGDETILLVEDENEVRELVQEILQSVGYTVLASEGGEAAFRASSEHPGRIDLLITDVVLPQVGGRQIAEHITTERPQTKVLFISGYTGGAVVHGGILDLEADFLQKPFSAEALCTKVRTVLDSQRKILEVLVVDDDPSVRSLIAEILREAGFQVVTAVNGREATSRALENSPDLVVTDLAMPDGEGIETIRLLRKRYPHLKIIAMSGAFGSSMLDAARFLGADATLAKPLTAETLLECIDHLAEK